MNVWDLTPHQLDVIRTLFAGVGATGGLFGGLAALFSYLNRKGIKQVVKNTQSTEWESGTLKPVSVAELAHRSVHNTEEVKGEITHMANEPKLHGRRRLPTTEIPRLPRELSQYKAEDDNE